MRQIILISGVAALVIVVAGLLLRGESPTASKFTVAATVFPIADIVQNVSGGEVSVVTIVPPGASPHSYSLSPSQVAQLKSARVIFAIGHGLDDAVATRTSEALGVPIVNVDDEIELRHFAGTSIETDKNSIDPHYWLTIPNGKKITATVAEELTRLYPEMSDKFESRLSQYQAELDKAEIRLNSMAQSVRQKNIITMHDAWGYFTDHYGFSMVDTYEPIEGQQPSPTDIANLGEVVDKYSINSFYVEPQKQSSAAVQFLQNEFAVEIKTLDPIGGVEIGSSYISMMESNMEALAD